MSIERIQILSDAENDLYKGKAFYDKQGNHVGDYFFDSLLSDIESLAIYVGIHKKEFGFYRMLAKRFPYAIYYDLKNYGRFCCCGFTDAKRPFMVRDKNGQKTLK